MNKHLKLFANHSAYSQAESNLDKPNVAVCQQEGDVHYNPLPLIIATDETNLPLMNIARTYGWIEQDATEFYESEAKAVTNISKGAVNTFVNTHTQETLDTSYGTYTLDLWYDKDENKWYDTTELFGGDFSLTNISFKRIRPIKSQDGETATLYDSIDWSYVEHFNEFKYFTSVTSIGEYAFNNCSSLTSITIPDSVTSIGYSAFQECTGLTNVIIPNSVTSIGENIFDCCYNLINVTIGNSIVEIPARAFFSCESLTEIIIPNSVTYIGTDAFYGCINLINVTIGNGIINLGQCIFNECTKITSILSLATTAPNIVSDTFFGINTNGTLIVPSGSIGYNIWMQNGESYLGYYNWTKVEQ